MNAFLRIVCCLIFLPVAVHAQDTKIPASDSASAKKKPLTVTGEIGTYGELYSIQGQPGRRPPATGRIFFRPTLNFFGMVQVPFEFLISTEDRSLKQNINHFGISPQWKWGSLHAGDFTEDYSQYTLSGITIRGGGLNLTPGKFRFSAAAGLTRRSVFGGAQDGSFKRFLWAAKIGYGKTDGSFVDLIFLHATDETGSSSQDEKTITVLTPNGNDVLNTGSLHSIRWNSYGLEEAIKIELSRDGGTTWELIAENQPNAGFYNWTVSGITTFQALVKISDQLFPGIYDISDQVFTIGSGVETFIASGTEEIINPYAVTPQENLLVATKGRITLLKNKISLDFDGGGSAYTRDIRSTEINPDSSGIPDFFSGLYKSRVGSHYDFAVNTLLNLNFKSFSTKIGFKNIGPGYYSLGTAYLLNDIREYSIMNAFRIKQVSVSLGYIRQNDNLIRQKLFTTSRNIITSSLNAMITKFWNSSLSFNYINLKNDSDNDSTKTSFGSFFIGMNQLFMIKPQGVFRNINLNYAFNSSDNKSYLLQNIKSTVHTLNLSAGLNPIPNLSTTLSAGFITSEVADTSKIFTHNYSVLLQLSNFSNKLVTSLNLASAFSEGSGSFRAMLSPNYRFSKKDQIGIFVSYTKYNGIVGSAGDFNEFLAGLNYSHRF